MESSPYITANIFANVEVKTAKRKYLYSPSAGTLIAVPVDYAEVDGVDPIVAELPESRSPREKLTTHNSASVQRTRKVHKRERRRSADYDGWDDENFTEMLRSCGRGNRKSSRDNGNPVDIKGGSEICRK